MATGQQDPKPLSTMAAIAARAAERESGGVGPFTDDDGNTYTIEFDPETYGLALECEAANGDRSYLSVRPGVAQVITLAGDESTLSSVFVNLSGASLLSGGHALGVTPDGVTIDEVDIDPAQPWPGG